MKMNTLAVKRILAMVLSVALMLTTTLVTALTAYAQEGGACAHVCNDGTCGYAEGADCTHVCGEDCAEGCIHTEHDGECGYIAAAPCKHEHDEDCGDRSPAGGLPTTLEEPGGGTREPAAPTDFVTVLGFSTPAVTATVPLGTSYDDLPLPENLSATVEGEPGPADIPVEWTDDDYDGDTPGDYGFTGALGAGYILADGVNPPTFIVTVEADAATPRMFGGIMTLAAGDISTADYTFVAATGTLTVHTDAGTTNWKTSGGGSLEPADLKAVVIEGTVTNIGSYSFNYCTELETLEIKSGVSTIGKHAFRGCNKIPSVNLPNSIRLIEEQSFDSCSSLISINIPNSVTDIGNGAFLSSGIKGVLTIPDSLKSIGEDAFKLCAGITEIVFPQTGSLTAIGGGAFGNCSGITELTIPSSIVSIGSGAFTRTGIQTLNLPASGLEVIGDSAFSNNSDITGALTIPSSVTAIGTGAFYNCAGITELILPETGSLTIGTNAFWGTGLTGQIRIPPSVTAIGQGAFFEITNLTSFLFTTMTAPTMTGAITLNQNPTWYYPLGGTGYTGSPGKGPGTTMFEYDPDFPPAILTASLPNGRIGEFYDQILTAAGTPPFTWSIDSGSQPNGLSIADSSGNGTISGTPSESGTFTFTVKVSNSHGWDTKAYTLTVYSDETAVEAALFGLSDLAVGKVTSGSITYTMINGVWADSINTSHFFVTGLPPGVTAGTAERTSDTVVTLPVSGTPVTVNGESVTLTLPVIPASNIAGATSNITPTGILTLGPVAHATPSAPTLASRTPDSVTLTAVTGYEYKMDDGDWQTSNVFKGLQPETGYSFYQRAAAAGGIGASPASPALTVKTYSNTNTIDIGGLEPAGGMGWEYDGVTDVYYITGDVTVIGSRTVGGGVQLDIADGARAVWEAKIAVSGGRAVSLYGAGTFEMKGGEIRNEAAERDGICLDDGSVNFVISGGSLISKGDTIYSTETATGSITVGGTAEVLSTGEGYSAISSNYSDVFITGGVISATGALSRTIIGRAVTVSGGTLSATGALSRTVIGYTVTVSGGTVSATGASSITVVGDAVTVSGGTVSATGDAGCAISGYSITINDGAVMATMGLAIAAYEDCVVNGGLIFAYGNAIVTVDEAVLEDYAETGKTDGINVIGYLDAYNHSGGTVIAWNKEAGNTSYTAGTSNDLIVAPDNVTVIWNHDGNDSGISVRTAADIYFIPVPSVTVSGSVQTKNNVSAYITFNPGGETYSGSELDCAAASISGITPGSNPSWTYVYAVGDNPDGNEGFGTNGKPINVGNYKVTATYEDSYNIGSVTRAFTVYKADAAAPAVPPELDGNPTAVSVTVKRPSNITANVEFSRNGTDWYTSGIFSDLDPNTEYRFYMRLKETPTHEASPAGPALSVTTSKATLAGAVSITVTAKYGETLTADTTLLETWPEGVDKGNLSYQWKRGTTNIGTDSATYTLVADDIGQTIRVIVTAANCTNSVGSNPTGQIAKADGPAAPNAPTEASKTANSITLTAITGAEYRLSTEASGWQDSPTFTGLTANTGYTFYARLKATNTHNASPESAVSATITTLKSSPSAPAAPELDGNPTAVSVTVKRPSSVNGTVEFACKTGTGVPVESDWKNSGVFDNLDPNTEYSFYMRLAETSTHKASPASDALTVTTEKAALGGTVTITGTAKYGDTLTADTAGLSSTPSVADLGMLSHEWKNNGDSTVLGTGVTYTVQEGDIGKTIAVTVTAANCTGSVVSDPTGQIAKADGPDAPASVTGSYTGNGTTFTYTVNAISGAEYKMDNGSWQDSNAFDNITPASSHTFYARMKATATHEAGAENNTGSVTFVKLDDRTAPSLSYMISSDRTAITIAAVTGAEYSFDGGFTWGTSNSKSGYTGTETVSIQIRLAGTDTHNPSPANYVLVDLSKGDQAAPPAFTMTYAYNSGTNNFTVTIPTVTNGEYSFDGITYNGTNTATANPGDFVTGYARYKETNDLNASPATASSLTLPVPVTSITVTGTGGAHSITAGGGTLQMLANVQPAEATQTVTWSISSGSGANISASGLLTATANGTVTVRATAQDGTGIYGEKSITISGQSSGNNGGGDSDSGGSSSGGGSSYTPTTPVTTEKQPNMPTVAKVSVTGTIKDTVMNVNIITEKMAKDAIAVAEAAAKSAGTTMDGIAVQFNKTGSGDYVSLTAAFERAALEALKTAGVKYVQIGSNIIDLTLDTKAITGILAQTTGNITVTATRQTKLSDAAKALIGNRPVFDIKIKDGKGVTVSDLKGGTATIGIPYKPASTEKTGSLFGVYVDGNGKPQLLTNSSYDNGKVIFGRNSLSIYGVGYKAPAPMFTDTANHWGSDNIDFVASRGLISGTSATAFSPDTAITRATFLMALGKLSGANVSGYTTSSFTDVANTSPAMPYIEWAVKNKIVQGIGNNQFGPDRLISRQDMAVMMVNYAKATGYTLPVSQQAVTFADAGSISAYAKDAVKAIQKTGVINGKTGNLFDPQGNATRAEASTILRRFVELVIDEGTARGWVQNDAGQWQYINTNGKAVTGWLNTDANKYWFDDKGVMAAGKWVQISGKWYYFYSDGKLAVNTTIDGYTVGEDGARKE